LLDNDDRWQWWWCDCCDGCYCFDDVVCRWVLKTMMMMYACVHRYKYVCVHYQFLSPYWLQHIMIYNCSSNIHIIDCCFSSHTSTSYTLLLCMSLLLTSSHFISLLPLPCFSSISLCTISYRTVRRLSI